MTPVRSVFSGSVIVALVFSGPNAVHAGLYAAGVASGCATCLEVGNQAQNIIRQSIKTSQKSIYNATGQNNSNGRIGFPMLIRTINDASDTQTANLRDALDTAGQRIGEEIRQIPFTKARIDKEQLNGPGAPNYDPSVEQEVKRGVGRAPQLPSAMNALNHLLRGDRALFPLTENDSSGSSSGKQQSSRGNIKNIGDPDAARRNQIHALTETLRASDGATFSEMNAGLLIGERNRILGNSAEGSDQYTQQQKADLYLQMLAGTKTSSARATLNGDGVKSLSGLQAAVDADINDMAMLASFQVMDRYAQMRRLHPKGYGFGAYMRKSMPDAAVVMGNSERFDVESGEGAADLMSDESFMALTSTYRSRSPTWIAKVAADSTYATREATMIAAERLYVKFQRLKAKREINMMLALILSQQLQTQRPDKPN